MLDINLFIQQVSIYALPVLLAITLHEVAHGWVALKFGDSTAKALGRLSLNPLKHIDPVGTIIVPLIMLMSSGYVFGWAKPVPVSTRPFKHPRRDMAWVALAGPAANIAMAVMWLFVVLFAIYALQGLPWLGRPLVLMAGVGVSINIVLAALNLLPLPPLDGGRILAGLVPLSMARVIDRIEPYGIWILLALLVSGALGFVLSPVVQTLHWIMYAPFGLAGR